MKIILTKKPKNPTIIEGFPGFGLVSTIATEFLIDHLKTEKIGRIWTTKIPAMIAVHGGKVVEPIGIFYNRKYNLVIVHVVSAAKDIEWDLAEAIVQLAKQLNAKEIISLEGIGSTKPAEKTRSFHYSSGKINADKLSKFTNAPLKEGIIMGLTGALMLLGKNRMISTAIFAEAHSDMPDSKAAAKTLEVLNNYLGLKIDTKPLIKQAEKFEAKLKGMLSKAATISKIQDKKKLSYVG
ncbi:PAC2 family protein [Candidatus Woesearchaeota archaeon]|nr:PAC2 family protein [Candidatus Woesearchaeota archaeon]